MLSRRHFLVAPLAGSFAASWVPDVFAQAPIKVNIPGTLDQLDQLLSSSLARVGLATVVRTVYSFRRQIRPAGYETTNDWNQKFEASFAEFDEVLWKLNLQDAKRSILADKSAVAMFEKAYAKNAQDFSKFHSEVAAAKSAPAFVQASPPDTLAQGQLLFAAVLRARSADSLAKAASVTAIWPFCG
jgi:hypothetical protein